MFRTVASLLTYCTFVELAIGDAFLSLKFLSFRNPDGLVSGGGCCDGVYSWCTSACDHSFTICLDRPDGPFRNASHCAYSKVVSGSIDNADSITFQDKIGIIANPFVSRMESWPGRVRLKIEVVDVDGINQNDDVDCLQTIVTLQPNSYQSRLKMNISSRTELIVEATIYCGEDYYGVNCDQYCKPRNDNMGHYKCNMQDGTKICLPGYSGADCKTNTNDCLPSLCQNGRVCTDLLGAFQCNCPVGFTGVNCEQNINECFDGICKNGGTCVDIHGSYECKCSSFWKGRTCEENINDCLSDPCKNGGTCDNVNNGFKCVCPTGFMGRLCEEDVNECAMDVAPCRNNAKCQNMIGTFHCECNEGWIGPLCNEDLDECLQLPNICNTIGNSTDLDKFADSHTVCLNTRPGYKCICSERWTGQNCEVRLHKHHTVSTENWLATTIAHVTTSANFEKASVHSVQMDTKHSGRSSTHHVNQTGTEAINNNNKNNYVEDKQVELDNLPNIQTGQTGNVSSTDHVHEATKDIEENSIVVQNNETKLTSPECIAGERKKKKKKNETKVHRDITVPFYLACQIPPSEERTINRGLMQMFLDTQLFEVKDLTVSHTAKIETSTTGFQVTFIHPVVITDGKQLSDRDIRCVINMMSHKITDYFNCSLYLGDVHGTRSSFSSFLNSTRSYWILGSITGCVVLVLAVVITISLKKHYRRLSGQLENKTQTENSTVSVVNDMCITVDDGPVKIEGSDCNGVLDEDSVAPEVNHCDIPATSCDPSNGQND